MSEIFSPGVYVWWNSTEELKSDIIKAKKFVPPLKRVPGYPLFPGVGSSAPGPRLSPDSLQQKSVSADHSQIAPARIRIMNWAQTQRRDRWETSEG